MIQFYIFMHYILWICALLGFGSVLHPKSVIHLWSALKISTKEIEIAIYGFFGFIIITVFGSLINFWMPITPPVGVLFLIIGCTLFAINRKSFSDYNLAEVMIIIALIIYCATFPLFNCKNFDTGLYHLQSIKWITQHQLPLGLANLHGRFGFNSSWFVTAALLEPYRQVSSGPFFILNSVILFFFSSAIFLTINNLRLDNLQISTFFISLAIIPWFLKFSQDFSSPSPDIPVVILALFTVYLVIKTFEAEKPSNHLLVAAILLSAFLVTLKLSGAVMILGIALTYLYAIVKQQRSSNLQNRITFTGSAKIAALITAVMAIIAPWVAKGIYTSGCIAYPSVVGCFPNLKWSVPIAQISLESKWVRSWARNPQGIPENVLSNWDWLSSWLQRIIQNEIVLLTLIAIGLILTPMALVSKKRFSAGLDSFLIPFFTIISCVIFWFFSAPDVRFGYGYLYSFAFLTIGYGLYHLPIIAYIRKGVLAKFKSKNNFSLAVILLASVFGAIILLSFIDSLAGIHLKKTIKLSITTTGLIAAFFFVKMFNKTGREFKYRTAFLLVLITLLAVNIMINRFDEFLQTDKTNRLPYTAHKTSTGQMVFVPPLSDNRCEDAPLPCTPYFNPHLSIEFSLTCNSLMFWIPKRPPGN